MGISCRLGRHEVVTRGVGNGALEFGRCLRCACDLMRSGSEWKRVPKGYKVVWKQKEATGTGAVQHRAAAVGREVNLRGVTVVGERSYGNQRFALVVLNAKDRRDYGGSLDSLGTEGVNGRMMQKRRAYSSRGLLKPREAAREPSDLLASDRSERSGWEKTAAHAVEGFCSAVQRLIGSSGTPAPAATVSDRVRGKSLQAGVGRRAA